MTTRSKRSAKSEGIEALIGQDGEMLRRCRGSDRLAPLTA